MGMMVVVGVRECYSGSGDCLYSPDHFSYFANSDDNHHLNSYSHVHAVGAGNTIQWIVANVRGRLMSRWCKRRAEELEGWGLSQLLTSFLRCPGKVGCI